MRTAVLADQPKISAATATESLAPAISSRLSVGSRGIANRAVQFRGTRYATQYASLQ